MKKVLTLILDGFGYRSEEHGNAIINAKPINFLNAFRNYPHALLEASGKAVGLEENQFGNSEIGHMTIGAGRVIKSPKELVDDFLNIGDNEEIEEMISHIKNKNNRVHLMGLFSNGLVHSDMNHFYQIYNKLVAAGINEIYFHLICDGRDTKTTDFINFYKELNTVLEKNNVGSIATICGRYYAMDRDHNYDRTQKYYNLIAYGTGLSCNNIISEIQKEYDNGLSDEHMIPIIVDKKGLINHDDTIIWFNYRTDRAKQIIEALNNQPYPHFNTIRYNNLDIYSFVTIDKSIDNQILIKKGNVNNPLGVYFSQLGLTQARVAETEKYAHVTYFFDGEYDGPLENCDRFLIPSPHVKTYDLKPEMSIVDVTKKVIHCMEEDYDFILCNFANPDMVGHTGNMEATTKAIMAVDICLGKLIEKAQDNFYKVIILADHGNADQVLDENNNPVTTHTMAPVPFIIMDDKVKLKSHGDLTNVAPTILKYMDIALPKEMKETKDLFAE